MPQQLNRIALALALVLAATGAAWADPVTDAIARQLRQQGYTEITVTRTFLGRDRIVATSPTREREIIVNPRTREILRDYTESRDDDSGEAPRRSLLDLFGGNTAADDSSGDADSGEAGDDGDSGGDDGGDSDGGDSDGGDGDGGDGDGDGGDGDGDGGGGDD